MAPVTFHGGPLNGVTVDADGPQLVAGAGSYRFEGASLVYVPDEGPEVVHVRPAAATPDVQVRPQARRVTRR